MMTKVKVSIIGALIVGFMILVNINIKEESYKVNPLDAKMVISHLKEGKQMGLVVEKDEMGEPVMLVISGNGSVEPIRACEGKVILKHSMLSKIGITKPQWRLLLPGHFDKTEITI